MRFKDSRQSSINRSVYQRQETVLEYIEMPKSLFLGEREVIDRIKDEISGTPILDIGVGAGRTTPAMLELNVDYLGIDFSETMIAASRARFPGVRFLQCDARSMEGLGDNRYGFIWYSFNGLDCVNHEERQRIISQVFGMLKPGGLLFFSSHNLAARRQKPWQLRLYQWRWKSAAPVKNLILILRGTMNYLRYRPLQFEGEHHAVWTDSGHEFGCLHYYVDPEDQVRRLKGIGFIDIETMGWSGQPFPPSHQNVRQAAHVYYLARKPSTATPTGFAGRSRS
jgi:SAM-dependent methyltransferase